MCGSWKFVAMRVCESSIYYQTNSLRLLFLACCCLRTRKERIPKGALGGEEWENHMEKRSAWEKVLCHFDEAENLEWITRGNGEIKHYRTEKLGIEEFADMHGASRVNLNHDQHGAKI